MTVSEYIRVLQALPQDAHVVCYDEDLLLADGPRMREVHVEKNHKGEPWIKEHSKGGASQDRIIDYCPTCGEYAAEGRIPTITTVVQVE